MKHLLLKRYLYIFFFLLNISGYAQNFHLNISSTTERENKILDSLNYKTTHKNIKSIYDETNNISARLNKIGFINNKILKTEQLNDSTYNSTILLNELIKEVHIYIGINNYTFYTENKNQDT
ncbi:hypothetical protein DBR27_15360, partial [Flavobacterium sp. HMWF030]